MFSLLWVFFPLGLALEQMHLEMLAASTPSGLQYDDEAIAVKAKGWVRHNTFAHLPWLNCFEKDTGSNESRYDVAVLGAPHDLSVTVRPGARYGPQNIRSVSNGMSFGYSVYNDRDPLRDWAKIVDCGDAPMSWVDKLVALDTLDQAHRLISQKPAANPQKSRVPRIMMLGGDHSTTLSALRSVHHHWGKVSVIHFDSHIDTWDTQGSVSEYAQVSSLLISIPPANPTCSKLDHGTFLYIAHQQGLLTDTSIHAGLRARHFFRQDVTTDQQCGFSTVTARDIDKLGIQGVIGRIRERVGDGVVYVTVDIDVLDPAFAPATGTPEPGGWSTRELLSILNGLEGLKVVGADIVEVAPVYDTISQTTVLAATEIGMGLLDLLVAAPVEQMHPVSH
ncbi:hypothetical protein CDD81_5787 [Ophiocordyceps australis]|uniref:Agmatinase n=1 Tax=Ophiocordyceps australis TaxID=1399860 RepID=A0A2C5Y726_9HYPO|nr:hypothetical protein CDD81_5787 [Ophiocordyceps australis]